MDLRQEKRYLNHFPFKKISFNKIFCNTDRKLVVRAWGITAQLASEYSIDDINKYIKDWLMGYDDVHTLNHIQNIYHRDDDDNSPFWSRTFSGNSWSNNHEKHFYKTLQILNQKNVSQYE